MIPKVYLASGWFNPEQKRMMDEIYFTLDGMEKAGYIFLFAPFYDGIVLDPKNDPDWKSKMKSVWDLDIEKLTESDLVVASTQDHDVGTIFECGFASAEGIPILCYNSNPELGLNLMLSQEARGFIKSQVVLMEAVESFLRWYHKESFLPFTIHRERRMPRWEFNKFEGIPI